MDPFDIPIVKRCCASSDNIRDYFLEERYLIDMDQNDMVTPQLLSVSAVDLVLDELSEIGIETNFRAEDLLLSPIDLNTMFALRSKLDKDNFYRCVKSMTPETYSAFCGVVENVQIAEDLLIEISDFMTAVFPVDTSWEIVQRSIEYWYSTKNFSKHVSAILSKVDVHTDPNTTPLDDDNIVEISQFLEVMKERDNKVKILSDYILKHVFSIDGNRLLEYIKNYDRDKLNPDLISKFAHYNVEKTEEEPDFVKQHHENAQHHLEYWKKKDDEYERLELKGPFGPNLEQAIMIVISLVLDDLYGEELYKKMEEFKPYVMNNVWIFMENLATFDYPAILRGEVK